MAILITGKTWATGQQVTANDLNAMVNSAIFHADAVDNATIALVNGKLTVKDAGVSSDSIDSTGPSWDGSGNLTVGGDVNTTGVNASGSSTFTGGVTSGGDVVSDTDSTDSLGTTSVRWLNVWADAGNFGTLVLGSGSITDTSGAISFGNENLTTTGVLTAATLEATGDTSAGDNAAIGYTATEGLIITGQGSTSDVTLKNDADAVVATIPTGTTNFDVVGDLIASTIQADGDTAAGDSAAMGYTATEGLILTGQGSTNDVTIKNDADADVISIPTGTTNVTVAGTLTGANLTATSAVTGATVTSTGLATLGDITLSAANPEILGNDTDGITYIYGGASTSLGGGIRLYGDTHATQAKDVEILTNGTVTATFDGTTQEVTLAGDLTVQNYYGNVFHSEFDSGYCKLRYGASRTSGYTDIDLRVTSGCLEWRTAGAGWENSVNSNITTDTTTSYTLVEGDASAIVEMNNASANTVTIPPNSSVAFVTGTRIDITQYGAGATSLVAGAGVTIRGNLDVNAQYEGITIYKRGTDEWVAVGGV